MIENLIEACERLLLECVIHNKYRKYHLTSDKLISDIQQLLREAKEYQEQSKYLKEL